MNDTPNQAGSAGIVDRAKSIILSPSTEWAKIAGENDAPMQVFTKYVVLLAAIGPIASFIGGQVFGYGAFGISYKPGLMAGLGAAITSYVLTLVGVWIISWVANFVSPKFGGQDNYAAAFRLVAYSMTASWLVGIAGLIPSLGIVGLLGLYSFYLFYKGSQPIMNVPEDKSVVYTIVTVVVGLVVYLIIGAIAAAVTGAGAMATGAMTAGSASNDDISIDMGAYGNIESSEDGAVMSITGPDGEKMTITVDEGE